MLQGKQTGQPDLSQGISSEVTPQPLQCMAPGYRDILDKLVSQCRGDFQEEVGSQLVTEEEAAQ